MELPSQAGRVAIVTGANTGIGLVTARELARAGARVYLACRSKQKAQQAMDDIRAAIADADVHFLALDLASLASVRQAAADFVDQEQELHLLINNAGVAAIPGVTQDGFEMTFGINHLGHFLFTMLLMDVIAAADEARIVNVSSKAHYRGEGFDWDALRKTTTTVSGLPEYSNSKLANVLFTQELERRVAGAKITTYSLHPGVIASDIWGRRKVAKLFAWILPLFMLSTEDGAKTQLHCATSPDVVDKSGLYWDECKPKKPSRLARDEDLAAELWAKSLEWTGAPDWPRVS